MKGIRAMRSIFFSLLILLNSLSCRNAFQPGELYPDYSEYSKIPGTEYLEVLVYGDAGNGSSEQIITADAMSHYVLNSGTDIDFVINLGDSFYPSGVDSVTDPLWTDHFESIYDPSVLNMPFYSVLGNHDYRGNILAQIEYRSPGNDRWQMPGRYYSQRRTLPDGSTMDFFFLDTERVYYGDQAQLEWLEKELDSSTAVWKIVCGHRPLFSYGYHGTSGSMITRLQPILNHKADLYLAGHEHDLQVLDEVHGVYYLISGSAGGVRSSGVGDLTLFAAGRPGFMNLLFSGTQIICNVIESDTGIVYSRILKEK